jgi:vacuolar-type H+-ATPase subunit H
MEKDILSQVIEVEKEIQKCLEIEKEKVHQWLKDVKNESEEEFLREEKTIRMSLDRSLAEATKQAEAKSDEIAKKTGASVERLSRLSVEILTRIVEKEIPAILPG